MILAQIQGANAFLECEERFVDFCSIDFGLFVLIECICSPLAACQVNKGYLAIQFLILPEFYLQYGMRSR